MHQYLYGNIEHKGYVHISSNADFFKDSKRISALTPILTYDKICQHGDLPIEKYKCFWMVTSDLSIPGEQERLFLQVSGAEEYRAGVYAYGYMSDERDGALYGRQFLQMLKIIFPDFDDMEQRYTLSGLRDQSIQELPVDQTMASAELHPELKRNILLAILQGKRVILRLPATGTDAMRLSREYLLAIYERLPFEHRRANGCFTGASVAKINDWENPLPEAIKIVLMDGDADISDLASDEYQMFLDLTHNGTDSIPVRWQRGEKKIPNIKLVDFLADRTPEELNGFFQFCSELTAGEENHKTPDASEYSMFMDFYIGVGEDTNGDRIRHWAANLNSGKLSGQNLETMRKAAARGLTQNQLTQYFVGRAVDFNSIHSLGVISSTELNRIIRGQYEEGTVDDENCGLTFSMTESLAKYYPVGFLSNIATKCSEHYVDLALQYPCMSTKYPDASSLIAANNLLSVIPSNRESNLAGRIFSIVADDLERRVKDLQQQYVEKRRADYLTGCNYIAEWPNRYLDSGKNDIDMLYSRLSALHYSDELLLSKDENSWSMLISQQLAAWCQEKHASSVMDCKDQQMQLLQNLDAIQRHEVTLRKKDADILHAALERYQQVISISEKPCTSIAQMFLQWKEIDGAQFAAAIEEELKIEKAKQLSGKLTADAVDDVAAMLTESGCCRLELNRCLERNLIKDILSGIPNIGSIEKDASMPQIWKRLNNLVILKKAKLLCAEVDFKPWMVQIQPEVLVAQLQEYKEYSAGQLPPDFGDAKKQAWLASHLQDNSELMYQMAKQAPNSNPGLIAALAEGKRTISAEQIEVLYILGWSKEILQQKMNPAASSSWQKNASSVFMKWPELPTPKFENKVFEASSPTGLITVVMLLVGAVALVPVGLVLLTKASAQFFLGISVAILCMMESAFWITFAVSKKKTVKSLFARLAFSVIPGLLVTAGMLATAYLMR